MAYIKHPAQAVSYSKFRPSPPKDLITKIVSFLKEEFKRPLGVAVDVGCGSGQSTEILAPYFEKVLGIDNSEEQIHHAQLNSLNKNVSYRMGSAEALDEPDCSVDLVTAGMAIHWFDLARFASEVGRVLKPSGVLAVYGYNLPQASSKNIPFGNIVHTMIKSSLGDHIPDQSKLAYFDGYKGQQFSSFPFSSQPASRFEFSAVKEKLSINDLIGYISTMSAFQLYIQKFGDHEAQKLLTIMKTQIGQQLGEGTNIEDIDLDILFPYFLLLFRKDL